MQFSRETLQRIRDRADMLEIVGGYTRLERRGDRWWGLSPFKTEKTPSFTVQPEKGFYYCFATQQGGDVFKFVSQMEGLSFPEAVERLAEQTGVELQTTQEDSPQDRERRSLRELYDRVAKTFTYLLDDKAGYVAREYLSDRQITEASTKEFGLGYAPQDGRWLFRFLRSKSYSPELLSRSGLFSRNYPESALFRNRVLFPIRDERGHVIAFGGRSLDAEDRAKYINSPETLIYNKKRALYGLAEALPAIRKSRQAIIAEGYFDVIALHQSGVKSAVAPLGTAFTEEQARLLKRWTDEVVLLFDADSAGIEASFRAASILERQGSNVAVATITAGKDAADLLIDGGEDAVAGVVREPRPAFSALLQYASDMVDPDRTDSRELILHKVLPYINVVGSEIRRETMLEEVASQLGVSMRAVINDFKRWREGERPDRTDTNVANTSQKQSSRELSLMLASAREDELFAYLRTKLHAEDLEDDHARYIFVTMEDAFRHGDSLPHGLVDRIGDETERSQILDRILSAEFERWKTEDLDRAVVNIKMTGIEKEQRSIDARLRTNPDDRLTRDLLERKIALDRELADLKVRVDDRVAE